jgi:hypothetical protein
MVRRAFTYPGLEVLFLGKQAVIVHLEAFETLNVCIVDSDCVPNVGHSSRINHVEISGDGGWLERFVVAESSMLMGLFFRSRAECD